VDESPGMHLADQLCKGIEGRGLYFQNNVAKKTEFFQKFFFFSKFKDEVIFCSKPNLV
jgi:hypothetical protein